MNANTNRITKEVAEKIKKMVDNKGWAAVKKDPQLGPIVMETLKEQKRYENSIDLI